MRGASTNALRFMGMKNISTQKKEVVSKVHPQRIVPLLLLAFGKCKIKPTARSVCDKSVV
jgi:hypothetical protein